MTRKEGTVAYIDALTQTPDGVVAVGTYGARRRYPLIMRFKCRVPHPKLVGDGNVYRIWYDRKTKIITRWTCEHTLTKSESLGITGTVELTCDDSSEVIVRALKMLSRRTRIMIRRDGSIAVRSFRFGRNMLL